MLTTLRIKNLALVTDLTLELEPGYNVITGETGAGKSVIIGALTLLLGQRADRTLIRSGADSCSVEAVFDVSKLRAPLMLFLDENGLEPCQQHQLFLKRTFSASGANRQFVNGSPTSLAVLAQVGEWLVDMHGPHEHQSLLHPVQQLEILDDFGKLGEERKAFAGIVEEISKLQASQAELIVDEKTYAQQLDLLRFQVEEITRASLQPGEEETLSAEYQRSNNAAKLLQLSQAGMDVLSESDLSVITQAGALGRTIHELIRLDPGVSPMAELHEQAVTLLHELQSGLSRYSERLEIDPERLTELEARLDLLQLLKRKYGKTIDEINAFGQTAQERLRSLEQRDQEVARLAALLGAARKRLLECGKALTTKRRAVVPKLTKAVSRHLSDLGFKQSRFEVEIRPLSDEVTASGRIPKSALDSIEFLFSPNPGEPARPLRAIASSGELARVMLAIKTVLAADDRVPVLVFDEVDANVGGETANAVGAKMRQIAEQRQVLCITHLPQVAAPGSAHYVVSKIVRDGRTVSEIVRISGSDRVTEIARMLGGQGEAARKHAASLLEAQV